MNVFILLAVVGFLSVLTYYLVPIVTEIINIREKRKKEIEKEESKAEHQWVIDQLKIKGLDVRIIFGASDSPIMIEHNNKRSLFYRYNGWLDNKGIDRLIYLLNNHNGECRHVPFLAQFSGNSHRFDS